MEERSPRFLVLGEGHSFVGGGAVDLPDGTLLTEVVSAGGDAMLVAQTVLDAQGEKIFTETCGYCAGVKIGCADCPGGRIDVNCVTRTFSCY